MSLLRPKIDWSIACGRAYLSIDGLVVAVEGDMCRDVFLTSEYGSDHWNLKMIEGVATRAHKIYKEGTASFASLTDLESEAKTKAYKAQRRAETNAFHKEHLAKTVVAIEATHNEAHELWARWATDSIARELYDGKAVRNDRHVKQVSVGICEKLGELAKMPVMLTGFWYYYDERLVLFWEMTSQVTDGRMADEWLKEKLPKDCYKTDATNFGNALGHIDRLNGVR